mmetsp:Transcript_18936/g.36397  ORF Transcript_18936/g.36397 Transcript_18936/m.36397 type:complete len:830 (-) Transcript_18936:1748-4237(-)
MKNLKVKKMPRNFNSLGLKKIINKREEIIKNQKKILNKYTICSKNIFNKKILTGLSLIHRENVNSKIYLFEASEMKIEEKGVSSKKYEKKKQYLVEKSEAKLLGIGEEDEINVYNYTILQKELNFLKEEKKILEKEIKSEMYKELKKKINDEKEDLKEQLRLIKNIYIERKINKLYKRLSIRREIVNKIKESIKSNKKKNNIKQRFFKMFKKKRTETKIDINELIEKELLIKIDNLYEKNSPEYFVDIKNKLRKKLLIELHKKKLESFEKIKNNKKVELLNELNRKINIKEDECALLYKRIKGKCELIQFFNVNNFIPKNNFSGMYRSFLYYYISWVFFLHNFLKINKKIKVERKLPKINNVDLRKTKYPYFTVFNRSFFSRNLISFNTSSFFPHPRFFITEIIRLRNKISYKTNDFDKKINFLNPDIKLFFQSYEIILYIAFKYGFKGQVPDEYLFVDEKIVVSEKFLSNFFYLDWKEKLIDPKFLIFTSFVESFSNFDRTSMHEIARREFNLSNDAYLSALSIDSKSGYLKTVAYILSLIYFNFEIGETPTFWYRLHEFMNISFAKQHINESRMRNVDLFFMFIKSVDPIQSIKFWKRIVAEKFLMLKLDQDSNINVFKSYNFPLEKLALLHFIHKKNLNDIKIEDLLYNVSIENIAKHNFRSFLNFSIFLAASDVLKMPYLIRYNIYMLDYPISVLYDPENLDKNFPVKKAFNTTILTEKYSKRCFTPLFESLKKPGDKKFFYDTMCYNRNIFDKDMVKTTMFQYIPTNIFKMVEDEIVNTFMECLNFEDLFKRSKYNMNEFYDQFFYQKSEFKTPLLRASYPKKN